MKILVLSQYWHPENGVPQRRWTWLTKVLQDAGHEVSVLAPPPHYKRKLTLSQWLRTGGFRFSLTHEWGPNGEQLYRSGFFPTGSSLTQKILGQGWTAVAMVAAVIRLRLSSGMHRPDMVIGTVPALPTGVVTLAAARLFGIPYLIDLRDAWPALFRESSQWNEGTGKKSLRERLLSRGPFQLITMVAEKATTYVLTHARAVITTSTSLESELNREGKDLTSTVRNVFPSQLAKQISHEKISGENCLNVLYAGTLGRAQRLENAVMGAAIARDRYGIEVHLKFVGEGATRGTLERAIDEFKVDAEIFPLRRPEDLGSYYEWADTALVHLTGWESLRKAIPSKTYELMRLGLHISGVIEGETSDLIRELRAGDVVRPDNPDALAQLWLRLAKNPEDLRISSRGREWVEHEEHLIAPQRITEVVKTAIATRRGIRNEN